jgi:hypothetical protein
LAAIGLGIVAFAVCVAVSDVLLPWDTDTNVVTRPVGAARLGSTAFH